MLHFRKIIFYLSALLFLVSATMLLKNSVQAMWERQSLKVLAAAAEQSLPVNRTGIPSTPSNAAAQTQPQDILPQYELLHRQNPHMVGWISIADTTIHYPVMQTKDRPDYYLSHGFRGEKSNSGLPFLDTECDVVQSNCLIVYGHNMKSNTMFAPLLKYEAKEFWEQHPLIRFDTLQEERTYQVAGAFYTTIPPEGEMAFRYYAVTDFTQEQFTAFVNEVQARMLYDTQVAMPWGSQLLILSTCSYHAQNGRFVVIAIKQ